MRLILFASLIFAQTTLGSEHPGNVYIVGDDVRVHVPAMWVTWRAVDVDGKEVGHGTVLNGTAQLGKLPTGYFEIREKDGSERVTAAVLAKTMACEDTPIAIDTAMSWFYPKAGQIQDVCALSTGGG